MKTHVTTSPDGAQINFASAIDDTSQPYVVLVLPFGIALAETEHLVDCFARRYNVITWESRYILADKQCQVPQGALTVDKHVDDLFLLLDTLDIAVPVTLVGYCSGAGIALAAAHHAPERVSKLVLANGEFLLFDQPQAMSAHTKDIDSLLPLAAKSIENAQTVVRLLSDTQGMVEHNVPTAMMAPYIDPVYFYRFAINYQSYKAVNYTSLASNIVHPTLILGGRCDQQTNAFSAEAMHRILPNSILYIQDDGNHYHFFNGDSQYLSQIDTFMAEGAESE